MVQQCQKIPKINIIFSNKKLNPLPLRPRIRQECPTPHSQFIFNIILEVLVCTIRQDKEIKITQLRRKEIALPSLVDDAIVYVKNPKESTTNK
jgi:hypothetical protein